MKIYLHKTECKTNVEAKEPKVKEWFRMQMKRSGKATLQNIDEEFTWHVNYHFGNDIMNLEK